MIVVGDGGTIDLVGTGGGLYSNLGSKNHGINLNGATLIAGNGGIAREYDQYYGHRRAWTVGL